MSTPRKILVNLLIASPFLAFLFVDGVLGVGR